MSGLEIERVDEWPGAGTTPLVVAGLGAAESETQLVELAGSLARVGVHYLAAHVWGASSRAGSSPVRAEESLGWLCEAGRRASLPVLTSVVSSRQAEIALEHSVDGLWLDGRTTADRREVREIARALSGRETVVVVSTPVQPDAALWAQAIERLHGRGLRRLAAVHTASRESSRSASRAMWELAIELRRLLPSIPLLAEPGLLAAGKDEIADTAQTAMDFGVDGLMFEVHPSPRRARSQHWGQITPERLDAILQRLRRRRETTSDPAFNATLADLRHRIDRVDARLLDALADRRRTVERVADFKYQKNIAPLQMDRWRAVLDDRLRRAEALGLSVEHVKELYELIHEESIRVQSQLMSRRSRERGG